MLLFLPVLATAGPSTTTIGAGSATVTSSSSTTLDFPITRTGDLSYDAFVQYQTADGTAVAGTNYTAAAGSVVIPAGTSTATIPVTISGSTTNQSSLTFKMLLLGAGGGFFTTTFDALQSFAAESESISVALADINGDGRPDIVVANFGGDTVSILLNTTPLGATTPTFAAQQTFATESVAGSGGSSGGGAPVSVTIADVNGDGKPDLIVANRQTNDVSVLINTTTTGSATVNFTAFQTFAVGNNPNSVTMADVNGDGKPDIVAANYLDDTVSVLLNTTTPGSTTASFAAQQTFATGSLPASVTTMDANGDGKPDLIVANDGDDTVSVLLNTTTPGATTPSFSTQQVFDTGIEPFAVAAADINGDGKPDLIVANLDSYSVSVLLNTTTPGSTTSSFAAQQAFATGGAFPSSVVVADVNDDGKPDLVVTNEAGESVSMLVNTTAPGAATASFASHQTVSTGLNSYAVAVGDINGDGTQDLVTANFDDNSVSVLLNTTALGVATPSFATQQSFATGKAPRAVAAADLNGDGKPDLIVANSGVNSLTVLLNTTQPGAATSSFTTQKSFSTGSSQYSVKAIDVNGDGKPDLVVANEVTNTVGVLINTTAPGATIPTFAAQQTFATGTSPYSVAIADVNGDGLPDLIVANEGSNTVSVLLNTTAPGATTASFAPQQTFATGTSPYSVTTADVNEDGLPDLIVANEGSNTVSVLLNATAPGSTTASFATQQTFSAGSSPYSVTTADLNDDGLRDLIVADKATNKVSVLLNTTAPGATSASFATATAFAAGNSPYAVTAADVNGDGLPDLIVADEATSKVSVLINTTPAGSTTPSFAAAKAFASGSTPYFVTVADINGDGLPDLIVASEGLNKASVLLNTTYGAVTSGSPATGTISYSVP